MKRIVAALVSALVVLSPTGFASASAVKITTRPVSDMRLGRC